MKRVLFLGLILTVVCVASFVPRMRASDCSQTSTGMIPLTDLGAGYYQGKQGGLYPDGANLRPAAHEAAGLQIAGNISPRKPGGRPSKKGRVVLLSIGMSNTTMEFSVFKQMADADPQKNRRLVIVDGAQGGMAANDITDPNNPKSQEFWQVVDQRLEEAGVTANQVQAVWLKEADREPSVAFPDDATALQAELETIARTLKARFPNLQLTYCSSRIYAGYASSMLNPEPFAYQSGFAVKWMIERQINGAADLNFDPARGDVKAPWLAWGPYLWADGTKARSDGLTWTCNEYLSDGTHPAPGASGARNQVAQMLLDFFKTDSTTRVWFLAP
ncbi:MAG TPA: hypothetical protein VKA60_07820 [Blastocatellia bacterium]|nr:hypothetical protein [Blastocatellia bacterium]